MFFTRQLFKFNIRLIARSLQFAYYYKYIVETLFIKITNTSAPIVIGVVYRPPSGDIKEFNKEIELILSKLPSKNSFILGYYIINRLDLNTKGQADFEKIVISNGYLPLISVYTHHQPGCRKTCIDNIISSIICQILYGYTKFVLPGIDVHY